jgi:transcriptional regulator with PAS, ATPase and Fis domain
MNNKVTEQMEKCYEEYESLEFNAQNLSDKDMFREILKIFFKNMDKTIFKTDKDGNVIYNEKGEEIINWFELVKVVLFSLSKLIGNYMALKKIAQVKKLL